MMQTGACVHLFVKMRIRVGYSEKRAARADSLEPISNDSSESCICALAHSAR